MPIVLLTEEERLGTTVAGRYRLEAVLGTGGMAVVYRATHTWTGREVAVKFLDPRKTKDVETASKRFLKEGRVIGALSHPNVVKVLDMGKDEHGIVFQVLELLHGHTLAHRLNEDVRLTPQEMVIAILPIMDALIAAHEMEIIHRDLKPENIFISADDSGKRVPKLLDFGVAKGLDDELQGNLTREGSVLGTPYYMAPEQAKGASTVGPAADIFSLGTVLYECLVGDLPFGDLEPAEYAVALLSLTIPPMRERASNIDEGIAEVIDRALVRDPDARFASMLEFRQALTAAATNIGLEVPAPAVFTPEARATLLAMRDDESVDTLGEGTMLSDLLGGSAPRRPRPSWTVAAIALMTLAAAVLTFAFVSGQNSDASPAPSTVGGGPSTPASEDSVQAAAVPEEVSSAEIDDADVAPPVADAHEPAVVKRLAVKRIAFPRELARPSIDEEDAAITMETQSGTMRRDQPSIVREF